MVDRVFLNAFAHAALVACFAVGCSETVSDEIVSDGTPASVVASADIGSRPESRNPASAAPDAGDSEPAAAFDWSRSANDWFDEKTASSGIDFAYRNGEEAGRLYVLESLGGGAGMLDFDRDGDLDLFLTGGGTIDAATHRIEGRPPGLFRNEGEWSFTDASKDAGLATSRHYSHGCSVADYDRDGFADVLVCGYGGVQLYCNNGDGSFNERAGAARLDAGGWLTSSAWADIDRDGLNDLFLVRYVEWTPETDLPCRDHRGRRVLCGPVRFPAARPALYRNCGDGTFEDVSAARGITHTGNGLGVVAADLTGDGRCDFYVACDETANLFYVASEDGTFRETGQTTGVAVNEFGNAEGSMGVDAGDYDGDGHPDLFITNFEREDNALYRNLGHGQFLQQTLQTGLAGPSRLHVGFGTAMTDFDADGWLDLIVVNGHVFTNGGLTTYRQPAQLFRSRAGERFEEVSVHGGEYFATKRAARGLAVGDLDDDGAADLVIVHQNDPVSLLRNRIAPKGYVRLRLRGTASNVEAIGARVRVRDGGRDVHRWICSGRGYFSQSDVRCLVPLTASIGLVEATVNWPSGISERFSSLEQNRDHDLVEGEGETVTD